MAEVMATARVRGWRDVACLTPPSTETPSVLVLQLPATLLAMVVHSVVSPIRLLWQQGEPLATRRPVYCVFSMSDAETPQIDE